MGLEENLIRDRNKIQKEARREGLKEGLQQGQLLVHKMLLEQMTQRFGRLPVRVRRQVEGISSIQELRKLWRKVLRARNLEDMGLGS